MPTKPPAPQTKAEQAAALRATRRAALEAAALRENLLRRKAQSRGRQTPHQAQDPEGAKPCR
jgi:hypothetical protein